MSNGMMDEVISKPTIPTWPGKVTPSPAPSPSAGEATGLSFGEVAGDAPAALPAPAITVGSREASAEAHAEAGPEATESTEAFVEASPEALAHAVATEATATEAGEETATSYLRAEGYEASIPPAAETTFLPEASAGISGTETAQQEFAFLAPLVAMLVSNVGPVLVKAVAKKLSPRAKAVLSAIAKKRKAVPATRKEAGAEFGITSLVPLIAGLFEAAELTEGGANGMGGEAAGEESVNEAVIAEAVTTIEAVVDYDDRAQVTNTTTLPWRRYCALRILFPGGSCRGTGFLIGPRAVATAGHCVYQRNLGGWARRIEVIPGCNGSMRPYGFATATVFRSTAGWVNDSLPECDYGCIFLPFGSFGGQNLGSFGVAAFDASTLLAQPVNVTGFPGDRPFGELWGAQRFIKIVSEKTIGYNIATKPGESGAPVVVTRNGQLYVVGIHNYGAQSGNSATRVTRPVFQRVQAWAKA